MNLFLAINHGTYLDMVSQLNKNENILKYLMFESFHWKYEYLQVWAVFG